MSAEAKAAMVAKRVATIAARDRHGAEVRAAMDISDEAVDREQSEILARAEAEDAAREAAEEVAQRDSAEAYAASRTRVADAIAAHRAEAAAVPGRTGGRRRKTRRRKTRHHRRSKTSKRA